MTELVTQPVVINDAELDDLLLRFLAIPSVSNDEEAFADALAAELRSLGMEVMIDELGNVVGRQVFGPGPVVMIDCHLDTVPVVDETQWTYSPSGELTGSRIYGRGAVDMKGPTAAVLHAIGALDGSTSGTIVFSGSVAEELVEGPAAQHVAAAVQPDYVVICEPSQRRIARGQRGRAEVVVEIEGRVSHSAYPSEGINAAEVMADVITELRHLTSPCDDTLGEGILVLIDVKSQPYPSLSTVPGLCRATFDRRTLVGEHEDEVLVPIRDVVASVVPRWGARGTAFIADEVYATYTGHQVRAQKFAPAWLYSESDPIVAGASRGLLAAGLDAVVTHYKFCTNGSGTAGRLAIPTIGYGPGQEDQAHKVDEYIELEDLHLGARGYAAIFASLLTQPAKERNR